MKTAVIFLNHPLSEQQKVDLSRNYDVSAIVEMSNKLKGLFSQVPAEAGKQEIVKLAKKFVDFTGDAQIAVVQGEHTLSFAIVKLLQEQGKTCLVATTKRESQEITNPDGSVRKMNVFKHVRFREYA